MAVAGVIKRIFHHKYRGSRLHRKEKIIYTEDGSSRLL
jgi:hypothetical protein